MMLCCGPMIFLRLIPSLIVCMCMRRRGRCLPPDAVPCLTERSEAVKCSRLRDIPDSWRFFYKLSSDPSMYQRGKSRLRDGVVVPSYYFRLACSWRRCSFWVMLAASGQGANEADSPCSSESGRQLGPRTTIPCKPCRCRWSVPALRPLANAGLAASS